MLAPTTKTPSYDGIHIVALGAATMILLATLLWQSGYPFVVDIGTDDDRTIVSNFHRPENNITDTGLPYSYRWSRQNATVTLPAQALPAIVELRGAVPRDGTQVWVAFGHRTIVALPHDRHPGAVQRYHILWAAETTPTGWAYIDIHAQLPPDRAEKRELGMLVAHLALRPVEGGWHDPPLFILLVFGAMPLILWYGTRLAGGGGVSGAVLGIGVTLALVLVWHREPLWIQQFLPVLLVTLIMIVGVLRWTRWFVHQYGWWVARSTTTSTTTMRLEDVPPWFRSPVVQMLLLMIVWSGLIPLYLMLKYDLGLALDLVNLPIIAMGAGLLLPTIVRTSSPYARMGRILGVVIVGALLLYGIDRYAGAITKGYSTDFTALFRGVRSFVGGGDLYHFEHILTNPLGDTYKYPPTFVPILAPFTPLHYDTAIFLWHLTLLALLLISLWLLWRGSGRVWRSWSTLGLVLLALTFKPLVDTLGQGQADIILLIGMVGALVALEQGYWMRWGALLAIPAAIKLYPAYLMLHGVVWREWKSVIGFLVSLATLLLLSVGVLGWEVHATFLFEVMPKIGGGTAWAENQTWNGFLNRLATDDIALRPHDPSLVRQLTIIGAIILTGLTWWRVRMMTPTSGYGLWIVTMLAIIPIAWMHYLALLIIPWYQLLVRLEHLDMEHDVGRVPWHVVLLYAGAWGLLCYGNQWTFFDRTTHGPLWALLLSYKFYGLLYLWGALARDPTTRISLSH